MTARLVAIALIATAWTTAAQAASTTDLSARAISLTQSISALGERVAVLDDEALRHSGRLDACESRLCESGRSPWSGSITHRSEFTRSGGRERFSQRLGFELNYFEQINDELSMNFSLEKPLSGLIGENRIADGNFDDQLRLGSAFFHLQLGELEAAAAEED